MTLGNRDGPRRKELIDFVVLPMSAGYNALMGLPSICRFGAVISIPHFCLRRSEERRVGKECRL